ncbi:hypothetical protein F3J34_10480 [Klebsiella sp. Ap-873]|nr:hypothetical protein [Klebsiella sp. Ap-873]
MYIFSKVGLGTAAKKDVGTGAGQIPSMSSFKHDYDQGTRHYFDMPMSDGIFRTIMAVVNIPIGITDFSFPVAFPNTVCSVMITQYSQDSAPTGNISAKITGPNTVRFVNWSNTGLSVQYLAIGR